MDLSGKRAIVTGAASGIGRASAIAMAQAGATVLACDLDASVDALGEALAEGSSTTTVDVRRERDVKRMVELAVERLGGIDILFANAGVVGAIDPVVDLTAEDWQAVFAVNVTGTFFCIKYVVQHLLAAEQSGTILATASVAGLRAGGGPMPYSASKAAVINLVRNAACQLRGTGIQVNAICPGLIETGMTKPIFEAARAAGKSDRIGQLNPSLRAGRPEEVAQLVVALCGEAGSYVNGEAIVVDGGLAASLPFVPGKMW